MCAYNAQYGISQVKFELWAKKIEVFACKHNKKNIQIGAQISLVMVHSLLHINNAAGSLNMYNN